MVTNTLISYDRINSCPITAGTSSLRDPTGYFELLREGFRPGILTLSCTIARLTGNERISID